MLSSLLKHLDRDVCFLFLECVHSFLNTEVFALFWFFISFTHCHTNSLAVISRLHTPSSIFYYVAHLPLGLVSLIMCVITINTIIVLHTVNVPHHLQNFSPDLLLSEPHSKLHFIGGDTYLWFSVREMLREREVTWMDREESRIQPKPFRAI